MKKILTLVIAVVMSLACAFSLTACGARDLDAILSSGKITIATNAEFYPFEAKEGDEYVGIDIDIAQYIADELGVELVINNMEFDSVITSVQKGQSDLALAGLTISEDRLKHINFSDSYFGAAQYIIVKADDTTFDACTTKTEVDAKLATLSGNTAAQSGTTGYYYIKGNADFGFDGFDNLNAKIYDNIVSAVEVVKNGGALLAVVDDAVARTVVNNVSGMKIIDIALSSEEYGIGVNKGCPQLLARVNEILAELTASGELAEIFARHTTTA